MAMPSVRTAEKDVYYLCLHLTTQLVAEGAFKMDCIYTRTTLANLKFAVIMMNRFMCLIIFAFNGKIAGSFKLKAVRLMPVYYGHSLVNRNGLTTGRKCYE